MKKFMGRTMAKMNENRRNGRKALKGFTLVEIIVVLVILAILAAAMIPALTGYIDKAKDRTIIAEARNALTAAQTLASEGYGMGKLETHVTAAKIAELAELDAANIVAYKITNKGKVIGLVYKNDDKYVVYSGGEFGEVITPGDGVAAPTKASIDDGGATIKVTYPS